MDTTNNLRQVDKIRAERDTIVQNALACSTLKDGKLTTKGIANVERMVLNDAILQYEVMVTEGYEKHFDAIRYSFPPSSASPLMDFALTGVMKNLKARGASTFAEYREEMAKELDRIEQTPLLRYDVHMVLNIVSFEEFPVLTLQLGDASVQIGRTHGLGRVFSNEDALARKRQIEQRVGYRYSLDNRLLLTVSLPARNAYYAAKISMDLRDFVLALIEISKHGCSLPMVSSGPIGAIDNLDSTISFIFDETDAFHDAFYRSKKLDDVTVSLDRDAVTEAAKKYARASPDGQQIIRRAFSAYHQGITEENPSFSFMYFWSSLEQILLKDENLRHPDMLNRLYRLILTQSLVHEFELYQLLELRNALMHDAAYHRVGPYHRSLLKLFTGPILGFFLYNLADFTKDQIDLFYNNFDCHKNEFKRKRPPEAAAVFARIKGMRESTKAEAPS